MLLPIVYFSTRTRFAIQMMVDLATYEADGNVKIKDISRRQDISVKYLEQIITVLNKAGLVKGERGPQGGYRLGMRADKITAGMIVRLMEGNGGTSGSAQESKAECPWIAQCVDMGLWSRIDKDVDAILDGTTIEDLIDLARREHLMDRLDGPEYFI